MDEISAVSDDMAFWKALGADVTPQDFAIAADIILQHGDHQMTAEDLAQWKSFCEQLEAAGIPQPHLRTDLLSGDGGVFTNETDGSQSDDDAMEVDMLCGMQTEDDPVAAELLALPTLAQESAETLQNPSSPEENDDLEYLFDEKAAEAKEHEEYIAGLEFNMAIRQAFLLVLGNEPILSDSEEDEM